MLLICYKIKKLNIYQKKYEIYKYIVINNPLNKDSNSKILIKLLS